jgi:hypothetical protein
MDRDLLLSCIHLLAYAHMTWAQETAIQTWAALVYDIAIATSTSHHST